MKTKKMQPTLSLCMIVKNEEKFLPQCLASVQGAVDEIIIVDTGSTDKTVEIAKSYGAKVYFHPWEGSFSKARNYSLQYATCDWILVIDADEELERKDISLLRNAIQSNKYQVIFCAVYSDGPNGYSKHFSHRIFRRGNAHYEGIVHNQLVHQGTWVHTDIRIYHYGYNLSPEEMKAKYKRTQKLLIKQLADDETNPFAHQNYIRVLRAQDLYEEAVKEGFNALEICKKRMNDSQYQMIAGDTCFCLIGINRAGEAEKLVRKVLHKYPENLDMHYALGISLLKQNRYLEAIGMLKDFIVLAKKIKRNPQHTRVLIDTIDYEHRAWANIAECYFELKEYKEALDAIDKALSFSFKLSVYYTTKARILLKTNNVKETQHLLKEYDKKGKADIPFYKRWAALCNLYPDLGNPLDVLNKGLLKFPKSDELLNLIANIIVKVNLDEAEQKWTALLKFKPDHIGAHTGLAMIYAKQKKPKNLEQHANIILDKVNEKSILKQVGGYCVYAGCHEKAISLFSKYLTVMPDDMDVLSDIATCYVKIGQYDSAFLGYKQVLKNDPGNLKVIGNLKVLQNILQQSNHV